MSFIFKFLGKLLIKNVTYPKDTVMCHISESRVEVDLDSLLRNKNLKDYL